VSSTRTYLPSNRQPIPKRYRGSFPLSKNLKGSISSGISGTSVQLRFLVVLASSTVPGLEKMSYIPLREEEAAVIAESNEKMHGQGSQFAAIPAPIQAPVYVPQQVFCSVL